MRAANEGTTVVEKFPKEKVSEDFLDLADRLLDRVTVMAPEKGFLGNLLGRQREAVRA